MDYAALGFKAGLEIHQQLASETKLFCACPIRKENEFPLSIARRLRPAAGELDVVDRAALYEFLRNRQFVYRYHPASSCLVELDEKPPDAINDQALRIAVQAARLLHCELVDAMHVMRKTVVDGSSVSGFQRTALLATDGFIETSFGAVGIRSVSLEEDAATPLRKEHGVVEYRLDRLGIPLVEVATAADCRTPAQVKETAEAIGLLLRSLPVIRGIGSIRQDVNISIARGARVEIKGFQDLALMEKLVANEVARQVALLDITDELQRFGITEHDFVDPVDVTHLFHNTSAQLIAGAIHAGGSVFAGCLPRFAGMLRRQCGDRSLGKELSAYAEAFGLGIIHSDELQKFPFMRDEFHTIRAQLSARDEDAVFIVAGDGAERAARAVIERARHCPNGVPEETRVADGTGSKYTRPLPGSGRLYPETDLVPVVITNDVRNIPLPRTLTEKKKEVDRELPVELAAQIIRSEYLPLYEELRGFGPVIVATTLLGTFTDLRRRGFDVDAVSDDDLFKLFSALQKKEISAAAIPAILEKVCGGVDVVHALATAEVLDEKEIRTAVRRILPAAARPEKIFGLVMKELAGRADAATVRRIVDEETKP